MIKAIHFGTLSAADTDEADDAKTSLRRRVDDRIASMTGNIGSRFTLQQFGVGSRISPEGKLVLDILSTAADEILADDDLARRFVMGEAQADEYVEDLLKLRFSAIA